MRVLVTGGAGFIGSHVVEGYVAAGLEVVVVDSLVAGARENLPKGVRLYTCDICDQMALGAVFKKERPQIVSHHAAQIDVRRSVRDPVLDVQRNLIGGIHVLNLSVTYKVRRFIAASSANAIYGEPAALPVGEDSALRPLGPYGVNKRAFELYLETYRRIFGLPFVTLRYGNVYGPRQMSTREGGVVAIFCEQILKGDTPSIPSDGTNTRDYVEVSDVVRANLKALEFGEGGIFNIASGKPTTDYQIFRAVREALRMGPVEPHYLPKRRGDVSQIFLDISKAEKALTWTPKVELWVGIQRTADWFRRHFTPPTLAIAGSEIRSQEQ